MKRIILFVAVATAMLCSASAQNAELRKWDNKLKSRGDDTYQVVVNSKTSGKINEAHLLIEKSTKYQCGAVTFAGIGAGLSIAGALIGTKDYEDVPMDEIQDKQKSDRKLRKGLFVGAGVSFAVALCLEIVALDYKLKAGRSLRLFSNATGGGLAYTF